MDAAVGNAEFPLYIKLMQIAGCKSQYLLRRGKLISQYRLTNPIRYESAGFYNALLPATPDTRACINKGISPPAAAVAAWVWVCRQRGVDVPSPRAPPPHRHIPQEQDLTEYSPASREGMRCTAVSTFGIILGMTDGMHDARRPLYCEARADLALFISRRQFRRRG